MEFFGAMQPIIAVDDDSSDAALDLMVGPLSSNTASSALDLDRDLVPTTLPPTVARPVMSSSHDSSAAVSHTALQARHAMHSYFAKFAGCRNCQLEVVPVAAADAELLDLRRALPAMSVPRQFLDLEAVHVHGYDGDSSGLTGDESDESLGSFIDDAPVQLSSEDMDYLDSSHVAKTMPLTAVVLFQQLSSPATVAASKRRRVIITSSSSPA